MLHEHLPLIELDVRAQAANATDTLQLAPIAGRPQSSL